MSFRVGDTVSSKTEMKTELANNSLFAHQMTQTCQHAMCINLCVKTELTYKMMTINTSQTYNPLYVSIYKSIPQVNSLFEIWFTMSNEVPPRISIKC